jgi:hypothetical protein
MDKIKWFKDSNGKWRHTVDKKLTQRVKIVRLGTLLDKGPEDEVSDPDLLRESGGHVDPESGEWVENDY